MKILAAMILALSCCLSAWAISPAMDRELNQIEASLRFSKDNYKLDLQFPSVSVLPIAQWPASVQSTIYARMQDNQLVNVDGEFVYSASLLRSMVVDVLGEKSYVATYSVWGGVWNRSANFLEYYILSSDGQLMRLGTVRN